MKTARKNGHKVRVGGSRHSAVRAVFGDEIDDVIRIELDGELREIKHLGNGLFEAGAGCNLGVNPMDPNSNKKNSFDQHVDKLGYALPILGGLSHQTIGGFMSTSSAGGSVYFNFAESVVSFTIVDGMGDVRTLTKGTDEFNAAGVSMGLFGIIVKVQLQCQQKFNVRGTEQTVIFEDSSMKNGEAYKNGSIENQYFHSLWIPKENVDEGKVLEFKGNQNTNLSEIVVPYEHTLGSYCENIAATAGLITANWFDNSRFEWLRPISDYILDLINPVDKEPRKFNDVWWKTLPNDDNAEIDTVIKVQFTEIWIDIDRSDEVIKCLSNMFAQNPATIGSFAIEIYPAKKSPFWLSMSYGYDVIRIDPYWLESNLRGDMEEYFTNFWNVLLTQFPSSRLHWGKHFPKLGSTFDSSNNKAKPSSRTIGGDYCEKSYPKFSEWLTLRQKFDPFNIFLTSYWAGLLNINQEKEIA